MSGSTGSRGHAIDRTDTILISLVDSDKDIIETWLLRTKSSDPMPIPVAKAIHDMVLKQLTQDET